MTLAIEYPSVGATYHRYDYGVYQYDEYPEGSVLEGQERRSFVAQFDTLEEAQAAYPEAEWTEGGTGFREVTIPAEPPDWFDPDYAGECWDDC